MEEFSFSDPLYECDISYLIGGKVEDLQALIKERHGKAKMYSWDKRFKWGKRANTTNGYMFHIEAELGDGEKFYVWVHKSTPNLMAHETYHLTGDIMFTRGIGYIYESEENFAYLHGWLSDKTFHLIKTE